VTQIEIVINKVATLVATMNEKKKEESEKKMINVSARLRYVMMLIEKRKAQGRSLF